MKHSSLVAEANQKYPGAKTTASALGKLSLEVFEQLIKTDVRDKNFEILRDKYFTVRAAYEHESYKLREDTGFKLREKEKTKTNSFETEEEMVVLSRGTRGY